MTNPSHHAADPAHPTDPTGPAGTTPTAPGRRCRSARAVVVVVAIAIGALAACQPIVVTADGVESQATMAASPTTVVVGGRSVAAVEIRSRDCHTVRYEGEGAPVGDLHLRPVAHVVDADGTVLFSNGRAPGSEDHVAPPGSRVIDGGTGDAHRILVPVAGATLPLTIGASCTLYPGAGSGGPFGTWSFPTCTAWRRICNPTEPGEGVWSD